MLSILSTLTLLSLPFAAICQSASDGYTGYKLNVRDDGDPAAVLYETENTSTSNISALNPVPDVLLNASVHVGEIFVGKLINLDAQVLQLLQFNAGVDVSIDKVQLTIQNVTAKVYLEARLGNLVTMVSDVLDSIDLNPVIAELGNGLGSIINDTAGLVGDVTGGLTGSNQTAQSKKRSIDIHQWDLRNNILYSVSSNFEGNAHKQRVLAQNGDIVEQMLNNYGSISSSNVVGNYRTDMRFNGFNETVVFRGEEVWEEEYVYEPFMGLYSVSGVFKRKSNGEVVGTQLLAEARGGGSAILGNEKA
ncbi:hypothetical protein PTNB85_03671 [Pyrenophora teres f. teres]|nr:hypothetical protein HRS9139_03824 [Pyrenophora teres f. teres]KAE8845406.1 hypothetical protein PTNB85_03671 [Pyrenophora teres f. teres]KAE8865446.1 hypothetical protein PTNB29_02593 [Pyrenophora teres f. teres]